MRTARDSAIHGAKAKMRWSTRRTAALWSYLRSVDKDYPQEFFMGGDGLLLYTIAGKLLMDMFWSTKDRTKIDLA
jgi:hypothetical protein